MSDDGSHGLTVIAFVGSVFSPYYAFARRRGGGEPTEHVAINVALYGAAGKRWTMTERSALALRRDDTSFAVGPSSFSWTGDALVIDVDEITAPLPSRVKGRIAFHPTGIVEETQRISPCGAHLWRPIAPLCRVEASFTQPGLSWSGRGYFDSNWGSVPLEDTFARWNWSRSMDRDGTTIFYDVEVRDGEAEPLALSIGKDGSVQPFAPPPSFRLKSSLWGIARSTRADAGARARVLQTLEDAPFYARSVVSSVVDGRDTEFVHETVDLDRFRMPIVQAMLPFKMPRRRR